jgi:hypothetical protein
LRLCPFRLEADVKERTIEDLRGLIIELVAVDEKGKDQWSSLDQPELQKLRSIFSHQKLDLADVVTQVCTMPLLGAGRLRNMPCNLGAKQSNWLENSSH